MYKIIITSITAITLIIPGVLFAQGNAGGDWGVTQGALVQSPLEISGRTPESSQWVTSGGKIGTVHVEDSEGRILDEAIMEVVGDGAQDSSYNFRAQLEFDAQTESGAIVYSGNQNRDTEDITSVRIPVRFVARLGDPGVAGPTSPPEKNFSGPSTPPPGAKQQVDQVAQVPWYADVIRWIVSLFK
jgi:hypothetical protein